MKKKQIISVGILSLGCPKTLVDSELVLGKLDPARYRIAQSVTDCDVAVLNTCTFIQEAKQESIDKILELIELKKEGRVKNLIVLGCLFQRYPDVLKKEFREVDAFLGTGEYDKIKTIFDQLTQRKKFYKTNSCQPIVSVGKPGYIYNSSNPRIALTPKHFRYVKISEGCDHICTFCSIPSYRGKHRSRSTADIVREIEGLAAEGAKEIILTGQDTSFYGRDLTGKYMLPELIEKLNGIDGIKWIRLLYAYPSCLNESMIDAIGSLPKMCHYLDMPLQHISDPMLLAMKRGVNKERTVRLIEKIRRRISDVGIRTTLIVGFPGETERDFEELLEFMQFAKFERLGVFTYSQEEGTLAAEMTKQIPEKIKQKRFDCAMQLQQKISLENNQKWIGKTMTILVDKLSEDDPNVYLGRSYLDAPEVDGVAYLRLANLTKEQKHPKIKPGDFVRVEITGAEAYDLTANMLAENRE